VSAPKRTPRDERRRRLGQNFLRPDLATALIAEAAFEVGDLVVEVGAGRGACTFALARHGLEVIALERDPHWAEYLRREVRRQGMARVKVVCCDALHYEMPRRPFRAMGSLPFGATTSLLRHLLDDPHSGLRRADLIVQWEVARKRAATPPTTMLSTAWAPGGPSRWVDAYRPTRSGRSRPSTPRSCASSAGSRPSSPTAWPRPTPRSCGDIGSSVSCSYGGGVVRVRRLPPDGRTGG
jgi:23S rRNA (adenine-N6)-dimethyltransferase